MRERNVQRAVDVPVAPFTGAAHVEDAASGFDRALGRLHRVRLERQAGIAPCRDTAFERAENVLVADALEAHHRLLFAPGVGDEQQRLSRLDQRSDPRRVLAIQSDMECARNVRGGIGG